MNSGVLALAAWIAASSSTVFSDGAGVSTESDISDFRGANGFYSQERETSLKAVLGIDFFERHPQAYQEWFHEIYHPVGPNGAHRAPASLEAVGRLDMVITQNIDGLHQRAGSRAVWELHDNREQFVYTSCGAIASLGDSVRVDGDPVPACPLYASQIHPNIVMYDESLDQDVIETAVIATSRVPVLIVTGTSPVVYPAAGFISYFSRDHLVLMNTTPTSVDAHADLAIREPVGVTLGRVMGKLRARGIVPAQGSRRTEILHRLRPQRTSVFFLARIRIDCP